MKIIALNQEVRNFMKFNTRHKCLLRIAFLVAIVSGGWTVKAQENLPKVWIEYIETWNTLEDDNIDLDYLNELYERYKAKPINLNDTNQDELSSLFFISPFQQAALQAYIEQYGTLLSVNELSMINGYDSITIEMLRPIAETVPVDKREPFSIKRMLQQGRHNMVVGGNGTIEQARGYREGQYEGDPYRLYFRYQFKYQDQIQLQLSGDKDPGEAFFTGSQQQGFDHYGYHLMVSNLGVVKRAIIGQYNLQFGQGITLCSGYAPYKSWGSFGYRTAEGILAASPFAEYNYLTGGAATITLLPSIELTAFYANTAYDATVPKNMVGKQEDGYEMVQSLYQSGYHRTETEIGKKRQIHEQLWGANLQYKGKRLRIGMTAYKMLLDKKIKPSDSYRYNYYYFRGYHNYNIGIDGAYRIGNLMMYGEISMAENHSKAGIIGAEYLVNGDNRLGIYYRDYEATYWNLHTSGLGTGRDTRNEKGICLNLQSRLPWHVMCNASIDIARYPEMKYGVYGPSKSLDGRIRISKELNRQMEVNLYYRYKMQGENIKKVDDYRVGTARKNQLQGEWRWNIGHFESRMRAVGSWYTLEEETTAGWMAYEDLRYTAERIGLTVDARLVLFDIASYDARIYTMESGLMYDNGSVFYMDRGERFSIVVHYEIGKHWALGMKYSLTNYTNKETQGSGYDQIDGPHKQQWKVQLRVKF